MALSRRYTPEHPPGEVCLFGLDFSFCIPPGVVIKSALLSIFTNTVAPVAADTDWQVGPVTFEGRTVYCQLAGGVEGKDYQLRWTAIDSQGFVWPRTTLVLCAQTS